MPQRIDFEGTVHEFPDDFTSADIQKALASAAPAGKAASAPAADPFADYQPMSTGEKVLAAGKQFAQAAIAPIAGIPDAVSQVGEFLKNPNEWARKHFDASKTNTGPGEMGENPVADAEASIAPAVAGAGLREIAEPINKLRNSKATSMMKGALKLRRDTPPQTGAALAKTALENKIPVDESGAAKLNQGVQDIESDMQPTIDAADDRGVAIDRLEASAPLTDVERNFANQVDPAEDLAKIKKVGDNFMKADYERSAGQKPGKPAGPPEPSGLVDAAGKPMMKPGAPEVPATPAEPIPASVAQKVKRGTYRKIADDYGNLSTAQIESNKAIAHGIKEKMDAAIPELRGLNESQGKLLDLKPVLEHAVNTAVNGSSGLLKGAGTSIATKAVGGSGLVALTAAGIQKVWSDPGLRSRVAIMIYKAEQANPKPGIIPSMGRAMMKASAYLGALANADKQETNSGKLSGQSQ